MKHFFAVMIAGSLAACTQFADTPVPSETRASVEAEDGECAKKSVIVYFELWSSKVTPAARKALNFLADRNRTCNPERLDIYAYGDAEGTAEANAQITLARAEAVRDELVRMGANPAQINLNPEGQKGAVREDGTPRPVYRYAEIVVIP